MVSAASAMQHCFFSTLIVLMIDRWVVKLRLRQRFRDLETKTHQPNT